MREGETMNGKQKLVIEELSTAKYWLEHGWPSKAEICIDNAIAALSATPSEQEPVATLVVMNNRGDAIVEVDRLLPDVSIGVHKLFTHPAPSKTLSDEEKMAITSTQQATPSRTPENVLSDSARLDWCERDNNSKDYGNYFEIRTGEGVGDLRARIDAAMQSKQPTEASKQGERNEYR